MDINMNDVTFIKGVDNWIYLLTDGSTELREDNGIKVFYDDGNFMSLKAEDMAKYYEGYLQDVVGFNHLDMYDNLISDIDFWTSLGLAKAEATTVLGKPLVEISKAITDKMEKEVLDTVIAVATANSGGTGGAEAIGVMLQTWLNYEKGSNFPSMVCGNFIPSIIATMKNFNCTTMDEFKEASLKNREYKDPTSETGYKTSTPSMVQEYMLRQLILNQVSGNIMGDLMFIGSLLIQGGGIIGAVLGEAIITVAKPLSGAIKNFIDTEYSDVKQFAVAGILDLFKVKSIKDKFIS